MKAPNAVIDWILTTECNLNCPYCLISNHRQRAQASVIDVSFIERLPKSCGFVAGSIVLPIVFLLLGYDYEYMEKRESCPECGSHRIHETTKPRGLDDVYIIHTCKNCGHYWEI